MESATSLRWKRDCCGAMDFTKLTRSHGVKIQCDASVEECSLAVGSVVGHEHIKSASRMNNATVLFLSTVEKTREVVEQGVVIRNTLTPVLPLSTPSKKVIISNVPPFIKDVLIERELQRYGRLISSIRKIPLGCKSPLLKHLVSFRRQVYMVLSGGQEELNLVLKFKVEGFDYVVFVTSDSALKCFKCGGIGHVIRDCPRKSDSADQQTDGLTEASAAGPTTTGPPSSDFNSSEPGVGESIVEQGCAQAETELVNPTLEQPVDVSGDTPEPDVTVSATVTVNDLITKELAAFSSSKKTESRPVTTESGLERKEDDGAAGSKTSPGTVQDSAMDTGFKVPIKRKIELVDGKGSKVKKAGEANSDDSDNESGGSNWSDCSQGELNASGEKLAVRYKAEDISRFLRDTKGNRNVEVEFYFPDRPQFINDVACFIREGAFTEREVARLRKFLTTLRKKVRLEEPPSDT